MNCMNCGTFLKDMDLDYCPHCGSNVMIQKKVDYLSKYYYNQGLEKATIRDLSGAISCLKQSLTYDKTNIQARNLLGLVYFETGEVVAALSEWVISKNIRSNRNLASEYINKLQANPNRLDTINETIKKYNHALAMCREGHEDMAAIQLKKILTQNPKLIKGYHLLALILMKDGEWNKARRILKKAAKIDKTNTTTLRFLREVDEQTGVSTNLDQKRKGFFSTQKEELDVDYMSEAYMSLASYRERKKLPIFVTFMLGIVAGAAAFGILFLPAVKQNIYRQANEQIVKYSESLSNQSAALSRAEGEAAESGDTAESALKEVTTEKKKSQSFEALFNAYAALQQQDLDGAALQIQNVYADVLTDNMKAIYSLICSRTGVRGIEEDATDLEEYDSYYDNYDSGYDSYDSYDSYSGYDSGYYSDGY